MKRKWLFGLTLFFAGWLGSHIPYHERLPAWAGAQQCVDGDVNQDGLLNITDPIHLLGFLFTGGPPPATCSAAAPAPVSTVFIVRHGEKASTPADDPPLTQEGMDRAARLADVFKNVDGKLLRLISSTKLRTKQTVEPLATAKGLTIEQIGDLSAQSATDVANRIRTFPAGHVTVVAHHSTTIDLIARELGIPEEETRTIDTGAYDNLIEVLLPSGRGQKAQMIKLSYK